jgi:signal transduction histidine kinase
MPRPHEDEPRIIPLRAATTTVAELVAASLAAANPPDGVRITCDVDSGLLLGAEVEPLRLALGAVIADAAAAALQPDPASDAPDLREVLITAVDAGAGVEIEVADSGPGRQPSGLAGLRAAVERLGGTAACTNCPEGGTAVTLRLPHRRSRGMAA